MRRVVITGLGAVTPLADGVKPTWDALLASKSGLGHISYFGTDDAPVSYTHLTLPTKA